MSDEITPAIQRASQAAWEGLAPFMAADLEAMAVARRLLAAALDVEEMARAIHASDFPDDDWDQEVHTGLRDECLKNARAVRAALLGADS